MGLSYLHRKGIAHGNLSPEHILIDDSYNVKIVDYGLVQRQDFVDISRVHSPNFLSPETVQKISCTDKPRLSDLYSLAVILFMISVGQQPFELADEKDS